MRQELTLVRTYLKQERLSTSLVIFFVFLNVVMEVLAPLALALFIDQAEAHDSVGRLQTTALIFMALTIGRQFIIAIAGYLGEGISAVSTNRLRSDLVEHCLSLDMSFHNSRTPGELIERVDGDVTTLSQVFSSMIFDVLGRSLLCAGILVLMLCLSWRLGLVFLAFTIIDLVLLRRLRGAAVPHFRMLRQVRAELSGFFAERLESLEDIQGIGAGGYTMRQLGRLLNRFRQLSTRSALTARYFSSGLEISIALGTASLLALGAVLLRDGKVTLGIVYLSFYYTQLMAQSILRINRNLNQFQAATASLQRIANLYFTSTAIKESSAPEALGKGPLAIEFDNVSFSYTPSQPTLDRISFRLAPGETLGLVGRTGSGKTTIGQLILRNYDAQDGAVRVGGLDVRRLRLSELRTRIGVVTQEVHLFRASVRDNVTLFDPAISPGQIGEAIDALGLSRWYAGLPDGLDSVVNSSAELSAGEAQLLGFIRVLLRDPDIVILDEASSRLDPATERLVEHAVSRLLAGRTAIVIAHRMTTVNRLDRIVVLDEGKICEDGPRRRLLSDSSSRFAGLLAAGSS